MEPAAGFVGGWRCPGAGDGEVALVLGVGDRGGGELGELRQALLGAGGQRRAGAARREGAPDPSFNCDRHSDSRSHAEFLRQLGERSASVAVDACGSAGSAGLAGAGVGCGRDAQPEWRRAVADGDDERRVIRVVAHQCGGGVVEQPGGFDCDGREYLVERCAPRDEFRDAAKRGLLVGEHAQFCARLRGGDRRARQFGEVGQMLQHPDLRQPAAQFDRGDQTIVFASRRHLDVDDRHIGSMRECPAQKMLGVARLRDDVESGLGQEPGDTLSQQHVVFTDRDTSRGGSVCE